jgi:hypothetical protein
MPAPKNGTHVLGSKASIAASSLRSLGRTELRVLWKHGACAMAAVGAAPGHEAA